MTAVPYAEEGLFPPCPIPGCTGITEVEGEPCKACQELFGEHLTRNPAGRSLTSEQVRKGKALTLAAYRQQRAAVAAQGPERRANQTCWCCEQRRTCTRTSGGKWECPECTAEIAPGMLR